MNYEDIIQNGKVLKDIIFLIYGINLELDLINEIRSKCAKNRALQIEKLYQKYDKRNKICQTDFINNKNFLKEPDPQDAKFIKLNLDSIYHLLSK